VRTDPLPPGAWAAEGRRIAPALQDVAAAIVTGRDPAAAAEVALAIADVHAGERRVAIADLVGGIERLTPLSDGPGLLECLRDGEPLSDIARPLTADGAIFALPAGRGPIAERWVFESARWDRLVGGFREVDALLLLVTPPSAPGLETLIGRVDGVVAVDLPPTHVRQWPLLATVDRPEGDLPPIVVTPRSGAAVGSGHPRSRARTAGVALLLAATLGGGAWGVSRRRAAALERDAVPAAADAAPPAVVRIVLGAIVNPADSARAARFAVELVAANTLASANSRLVALGGSTPAPTVAPAVLGSAGRTWYRAIVGAWRTREEAETWLAAERARGVLRADGGRVIAAPLALQLASVRGEEAAEREIAAWRARGVGAYGLRQEDGGIRVFAGAFDGPAEAAVLAMMLRDLGAEPRLAYRIGRSF
jgi:hypothetical protein